MKVRTNFKSLLPQIKATYDAHKKSCFIWAYNSHVQPIPIDISELQTVFESPASLCDLEERCARHITSMQQISISTDEDDCPMPLPESVIQNSAPTVIIETIDPELADLLRQASDITQRIAELMKAPGFIQEELESLREERRSMWMKIEEIEAHNAEVIRKENANQKSVSPSKPEEDPLPRVNVQSDIAEINRTYCRNAKLSNEVLKIIERILSQEGSFLVNCPQCAHEYPYIASIVGIAITGPCLVLSPTTITLPLTRELKSKFKFQDCEKPSCVFVFDAHCVSKASPFYIQEYETHLSQYADCPMVMFSTLAGTSVQDELSSKVAFHMIRSTFRIPNVLLEVRTRLLPNDLMSWIIEQELQNEKGVVFCSSPRDCEKISDILNQSGIPAAFYHSHMSNDQLNEVLRNWRAETVRVLILVVGQELPEDTVVYTAFHCIPVSIEMIYTQLIHTRKNCIIMYNSVDKIIGGRLSNNSELFQSVLTFIEEMDICRHNMLCSYFGEEDQKRCVSTCDNCRRIASEIIERIISTNKLGELVTYLTTVYHNPQCITPSHVSGIMCGTIRELSSNEYLSQWFGCVSIDEEVLVREALEVLSNRGVLHRNEATNRYGCITYYSM